MLRSMAPGVGSFWMDLDGWMDTPLLVWEKFIIWLPNASIQPMAAATGLPVREILEQETG